jgi:hypothetical protein
MMAGLPSVPGVFWACFLALLVWGILAYLVLGAMIEDASNGF